MKNKLLWIIILCTLLVFKNTSAQTDKIEPIKFTLEALTIDTTIQIESVTIEAFRADKKTPITFKNISKNIIDLESYGQEPAVIIGMTPNVNTTSDAGNYIGYSYFRLRGIDQTRINFTLDGIPLNESEDQGVYFNNYPDFFNSINSVQIQRGVGTSSNGVASYAGSLNFQSPDLTSPFNFEAGIDYGSFNSFRIYSEFNSGLIKDKALYLRLSNIGTDGYKYHSNNQSSSAFLSTGIYKTKYKLKFTGFIGNQKNQMAWIGVPLSQIESDPKTNGNTKDERDDFTQALTSLQYTYIINSKINVNVTGFYNFLNGNYDFDLNNFLGADIGVGMLNYHLTHNFGGIIANTNIYLKNIKISTGLQINRFNRRHIGSERGVGELYVNNGYKNDFNIFAKIAYTLNKFTLFGDIQYRYTDFDYVGDVAFTKMSWQFINPTIGIDYSINKNLNIYYSFGSSGREPTRNDIFGGEDNLTADSLGHPILNIVDPEYVYDNELGIRFKNKNWHLGYNIYYMQFKNEIVLNGAYGPNSLPLHSNVFMSFRSGMELDFGIEYKKFYYSNTIGASINRIFESGVEFQPVLSPNFIMNQTLGYMNKHWNGGLRMKYQSKSFIDLDNVNTTPSFYSLDMFVGYDTGNIFIGININNFTNQRIITSGYTGIYGEGLYFIQSTTNYTASLRWKF